MVDQSRRRGLTDGLPLRFDAGGAIAKWNRLCREGEFLRRKISHLERLRGEWGPHPLDAKLALLRAHHQDLLARQRRLGHGIAWAAARWAVDQEICSGGTVIYVEELATLEPALGRKVNARISASVRGQFQDALRHLGAKAGCAVVTVPARGTSAICPRCVGVGCATTPPLSDCAVAITGRIARIAGSPRIATMPPLSASGPGASAPSQLSTRIPGPGIWRSAKPKTPRWRAACAAGPGWAQLPNRTPTQCPCDAGPSPRPRQPRSTASVRRGVLPRSLSPRHPARAPVRNPTRPHSGTGPDGSHSGAASTTTPMPPRSSLMATSVPRPSATPRLESLGVAETLEVAYCSPLLPHLATAAFLAISDRCSGVSLAALAFPPFWPPSLPSSTAAGFFPS